MTIFKPEKKSKLNIVTFVLSAVLLSLVFAWLNVYNRQVNASHDEKALAKELQDLKVKNAELDNTLHDFFSPSKAKEFAGERGLTEENHPEFLEIAKGI